MSSSEIQINPLNPDGSPKTPKQIEKEKKKAEKMAKFLAKKQKQNQNQPSQKSKTQDQNQKNQATAPKKETDAVPEYFPENKPGEKKILPPLDHPSFKSYSPTNVEKSWYEWWDAQGFFKPQLTEDGQIKPEGFFGIPAPPPNVTGALHIGHALTVAIQDTLTRFYRMKGKTTLWLPGFDHAGIATQTVVEKNLAKQNIYRKDLGREKFVEKVWEWKEIYHQKIKNQVKKLGASYDWSREAFTMDPNLSEAVIEAFVQLYDKGIVYRENKLVNWCVHLETATSNSEIENKNIPSRTLLKVPGYTEKVEFGVITSFAYPIVDSDEKIVVATTRPETLFGDTAVAVHPDDPRYKHLHGKFVQHPFLDRKFPIITDPVAVDMEFGTGAVKITPAHDTNDYETGKRNKLDFINIMTEDGKLNENCGTWAGMKRFDARKNVIEALKEKGLYIGQNDNEMVIPTCSRSGDILEPYMKPQWWVSQSTMAHNAAEAVKSGKIQITPKFAENDFFAWCNNLHDWCISRQLWWGHRCPAYFVNIEGEFHDSGDGRYWIVARNLEEAEEKAKVKFSDKKYTLEQDEDVLDTWFSSGLWPFATLGWPKNSIDMQRFYPFNLLETGWDIIFNWVLRMILLGIELTDNVPFKEVYCHSLVRDAQGRKMSKSLGNVVDPLDVIKGISLEELNKQLTLGNLDPREIEIAKKGQKDSYPNGIAECGTDALRFALCNYSTGAKDINLDILRVEGYRKFCNKIYQATKFALMRLGDDFKPEETNKPTGNESLVEKWILNKLNQASKKINEGLENRQFMDATNSFYLFFLNELCDVYIENSKYLILEGTPEQKQSARNTLYTCIESGLKLLHPFMPYVTEEMWQRLPRRANDTTPSIVVSKFPEYSKDLEFIEEEEDYEMILDTTKAIRSLLSQYNISKHGTVFVECSTKETFDIVHQQQELIVSLIKAVEQIKVVESISDIPAGCILQAASSEINTHVLLKGQIDIDQEIKKFQKKLDKSIAIKTSVEKIMDGKDYNAKASERAKQNDTERFEKAKADIESLEATIANLEKLKL
ncbi:valine--tRNA ligase ASCRUDRAFT_76650 [Ascoidea rubescens DSM 1968]|uniref:Valine--tRNA ligase, mitochondrial n=1 Tax=Ascoidea rubescens DSM 1968 TaxID=1344418 RepID=A0A1D2VER2_9ASCO|nr:hypothetical protein ASCRUDRAFT_76650 [Ascoidea rubescens DSM 1968]ODV60141.1 hypothetical protein ASCRUDRAFT_76650 [Ascoidea rubescens DSM 1968]